jgi:hypothetical protein
MARDYPKRKSWKHIYDELSKYGRHLDPPPALPVGGEDWERSRCRQDTIDWAKANNAIGVIESLTPADYYAKSSFSTYMIRQEHFLSTRKPAHPESQSKSGE